jgi:hypothetical protein
VDDLVEAMRPEMARLVGSQISEFLLLVTAGPKKRCFFLLNVWIGGLFVLGLVQLYGGSELHLRNRVACSYSC